MLVSFYNPWYRAALGLDAAVQLGIASLKEGQMLHSIIVLRHMRKKLRGLVIDSTQWSNSMRLFVTDKLLLGQLMQ